MVRVDKEEGRKGKQSKAKQSNNTNIFQVFFSLHERHNDDAHIHYMIIKSSLVSVYHLTQLETTIPKTFKFFNLNQI